MSSGTMVHQCNPQQDLKDKGVINSGCSRYITGNKSYLTDYEEINEGFVAFGGEEKKKDVEDLRNEDSEMDVKSAFLYGLQVKQKEYGIFISQDKYVKELLSKFGFSNVKTTSTPMETHKTLIEDEKGEDVDEHLYRSMIGSLMYLTSLRPDFMFTCKKQTMVVKSTIEADLDKGKDVWNGMKKLSKDKIATSAHNLNVSAVKIERKQKQKERKVKNINGETQLHAKVDGKKIVISEASIRRDL
nr:hypothetical protein [Tanacetum cinerariifolium]